MSGPEVSDFLGRLSSRDHAAAWLARELLAAGWSIRSLTGPVQMDVWELLLRRGTRTVRFGIERGRSDGVHFVDGAETYRPVVEAMSMGERAVSPLSEDPAAVLQWLNK